MVNRPDFFLVGAAKSGTTFLYHGLRQHPELFLPAEKEPSFFGEYRDPGVPRRTIEQYLGLFEAAEPPGRIGEASTPYLYSPSAAAEIHEFNSKACIIAVLRNPIERAYSHYWHHRRSGRETLSFEQALQCESKRAANPSVNFGMHYVRMGYYAEQVERFLALFPRHRIRVYLFEDLVANATATCNDLFDWLGVTSEIPVETHKVFNGGGAPYSRWLSRVLAGETWIRPAARWVPKAIRHPIQAALMQANTGRRVPPMHIETRIELVRTFREDVLRLQEILNRDLTDWLNPNTHGS